MAGQYGYPVLRLVLYPCPRLGYITRYPGHGSGYLGCPDLLCNIINYGHLKLRTRVLYPYSLTAYSNGKSSSLSVCPSVCTGT